MFASFVCTSTSPQNPNIYSIKQICTLKLAAGLIKSDCCLSSKRPVEVKPCVLLMYVKVTLIEETHCAQMQKR